MGLYTLYFVLLWTQFAIWRTSFKDHTERMLVRAPAVAVSVAEHEEALGFLSLLNLLNGTSKLAFLLHCPGQWLWRVPYTGDGCCAFTSKWQGSPCKTVCSVALVISFQNWCFKTINIAVNMYFYLLCMLKAPVTRRFLFYYCCWAKLLRTGTWAYLSCCCCLLLSVSFQKQTFISHCLLWKYFFSLLQSVCNTFSFHIFLQEL